MIKLKSLFRRGQGPSGSKNSSTSNSYRNNQQQSTVITATTTTDNDNNSLSSASTSTSSPPIPPLPLSISSQSSSSTSTAVTTEALSKFYDVQNDNFNQNKIKTSQQQQQSLSVGDEISCNDVGIGNYATLPLSLDNKKSKKSSSSSSSSSVTAAAATTTTTTLNTKKYKQSKSIPNSNSKNSMPTVLLTGGKGSTTTTTNSAAINNYNKNLIEDNVNANSINQNQNYNLLMNTKTTFGMMTTTATATASTTTKTTGTTAATTTDIDNFGDGSNVGSVVNCNNTFNNFAMEQNFIEAKNKMQELQIQLERLERENILLESKLNELAPYQSEVVKLRNEIMKLQSLQDKSNMEISKLKYENESLRNRLRDVVNSPLSDAEKHQIIQDSQRLHSSAPASIALPNVTENDGTPCVTPDWDKNSSSSEISVACLQDKIIQMEETHYSTNEELQATLQELADLQTQLIEIQSENDRLSDEKDVLFQSLCRQTEKLNESRTQITTLQEILLRESTQIELNASEREKKLLDLIKNSQDERETILIKQEELNSELNDLRQTVECQTNDNTRYRERISLLDSTVDAANAERKQIEYELQQTKDDLSQKQIEINRLTTLLDNARSKIDELEQDRTRGEKTDLSDLLDATRKEKDLLETRCASLQDQISRNHAEISKLKDQLLIITEECKVAKNNAKFALSHLEYRYETLQQEKEKLCADYQQLQDTTAELQVQCKCHLEDKAQLQSLLTETQKHLGEAERKLSEKEEQLQKEIKLRKQEAEEWQQFQSDLLMTVRVANDFKTEALTAREQLVIDNKTQKDKIRLLEQQIEKLTKQHITPTETHQTLLTSVQQEMTTRRTKIGLSKQDSRLSVKTLIESIENNKQQTKSAEESESRYSSNSSLNSGETTDLNPNFQPVTTNNIPNEWTENVRIPVVTTPANAINPKGPLREQQQQQSLVSNMHFSSINNVSKSLISGERKDPLNMLAKNGGSKRNALLKWCQNKTVGYRNIDITNFSSSWNDGLAFCAILHSYLPDRIPYDTLSPANKRRNFSLAFAAAESVGITTTLNINDMCQIERPDWTQVMTYVTAIYKHFET